MGVWGPTIETVLRTAKTMGIEYWPVFCKEMNFSGFYHLGEAFFWNSRYYATGEISGLSHRRWYYWKLLKNLSSWGINIQKLPITVIKGIDKLGKKSFRIARAILRRDVGYYADKKIVPENFFLELNQYMKGEKPLHELIQWLPTGDMWILFGIEDLKPLYEKKIHELYGKNANEFILALSWDSSTQGQKEVVESFEKLSEQQVRWAVERVLVGRFTGFAQVREYLGALELDTTDGVELRIDPEMEQSKFNVTVKFGWDYYGRVQCLCVQQHTDRTYHKRVDYPFCLKEVVREAVGVWHKQVELDRQNKKFLAIVQPENACILVFPTDSRPHNAGNCVSGTDSWLERHGWGNRWYVPVSELLNFRNEERVMRVLKVVAAAITK